MKIIRAIVILSIFLLALEMRASGPVGLYAMIQKMVFEPDERSASRIQIWGAFSFVEGGIGSLSRFSKPERGYLYFTMPADGNTEAIRKEWADLKAIAGTDQAIGLGNWGYLGAFSVEGGNHITVTVQVGPRSFRGIRLSVLNVPPAQAEPAPYVTNTGLVKLSAQGSHADVVRQLKDALK